MDEDEQLSTSREVTRLVIPAIGRVAVIEDSPGKALLDASGEPVAEVSKFFRTMLASGASISSLRSYGLALLRWWRCLAAVGVPWERAGRIEARDFVLRMRLVGPSGRSAGYAPATINHALAVVKMFYADRLTAGEGPLINPIPDAAHSDGRRVQAHHNPMHPFTPGSRAPLRQKMPEHLPRSLPDQLFDALFAVLGSDRDRAVLAFLVSTGARASELLGVTADRVDPGEQRIGVHRKGSGRLQWLPASADPDVVVFGDPADAATRENSPGHRVDVARSAAHRSPADDRRPEAVVERRAVSAGACASDDDPTVCAAAGRGGCGQGSGASPRPSREGSCLAGAAGRVRLSA